MKRVIVTYVDDNKNLSVIASDPMEKDAAEALRDRVEREHAEAGSENRWIRIENHSLQSRQIQTIRIDDVTGESPVGTSQWGNDDLW